MDNKQTTEIETETEITADNENADSKKRKAGWFICDLFEWGETVVSAVIVIVVLFTFVVRVTSVDGGSMNPTLITGDRLLVTNFFFKPKHEDIVILFAPNLKCCYNKGTYCTTNCRNRGGIGKDIIKRVIGVEGDTITIYPKNYPNGEGRVYRNGKPLTDIGGLDEQGHKINDFTYVDSDEPLEVKVPKGYIFVLGDNRTSSVDSRYDNADSHTGAVGLVNLNHVAGKAFYRVTPFKNNGFLK